MHCPPVWFAATHIFEYVTGSYNAETVLGKVVREISSQRPVTSTQNHLFSVYTKGLADLNQNGPSKFLTSSISPHKPQTLWCTLVNIAAGSVTKYQSSYVTHSFSLKGEEPPVCIAGDEQIIVEHNHFIFCSNFIEMREIF